jgi:hypothetical protein
MMPFAVRSRIMLQLSRRRIVFGGLAGVTLLVAIFAGSAVAQQFSTNPVAEPEVVETYPQPGIPDLTKEDRDRAIEIAQADATVARLIEGRDYTIDSVGVWHTSKTLEKIGAGVILALSEPASYDIDWPTAIYDRSERSQPPYEETTKRYAAHDVQRIVVMVDLNRQKVVVVSPGPEAKREFPSSQH